MELRSLSALTQLAERAEQLATEIRELNITADDDVQIPHVTLPLKLESAAEWLKAVDECRRKPRLARSKRLLEAVKIDTASIPADVLTRTESIDAVLEGIKAFPAAIQQSAIAALGRALTKGLDDAAS